MKISLVVQSAVGLLVAFVGFVNCYWGNDPFFGLAILLSSVVFLLPAMNKISDFISDKTARWLKAGLLLFILWAALGVGEFFDKMEMMSRAFPYPELTGI